MRLTIRLILVLCVLAFAAGQELRSSAPRSVPISTVDPAVCVANGPVVAVTESTPYVYTARCRDGVTLVTGGR